MAQTNINLPPYDNKMLNAGLLSKIFKVEPTPVPSLKVYVNPGHHWLNNTNYIEFKGGNSPLFKIPLNHSYWALLALNSTNKLLYIIYGQESPNPNAPNCPSEYLPLALVYLRKNDTLVTSKNLFDARPFLTSSKGTDVRATIEHGGTGVQLFEFTTEDKARIYSLIAGDNVSITQTSDAEIRIDAVGGGETLTNIDCGYLWETE